jgi:hypothetical protein
MRDALLNEIFHDERKRGHVALSVALDDRYRRIPEYSGVGERLEESVPRFIEISGGRDLRIADYFSRALIAFAACDESRKRNEGCQLPNMDAGNGVLRLLCGHECTAPM